MPKYQLTCSWKFKDHTSAAEIENLMVKTRELSHLIPGVVSLTIGENCHELSKGLTHGMAICYASKVTDTIHDVLTENWILSQIPC